MAITARVGTPSRRQRTSSIFWPIGFALLIPLVFVFYKFWLPNLTIETFFQRWLSLSALNESLVWVIMALGLNIVVGYAGLLDLGYVAFWAIGGYMAGWIMSTFFTQVKVHILAPSNLGNAVGIHVTFWLVIWIAAAFCALWGLIIGAPTLRLRSDYLALVTLGFGEIIPQVFLNGENIGGFNLSNGSKGINPIDPIGTGPFGNIKGIPTALGAFDLPFKFLIYAALAALCVFVSLRLRGGRLGRAWLAIREDELAASMMGVPLVRAKLSSYAVGAFFGGIGGVVYATQVNGVFPNFSFSNSITILLMVVLGGMGNVWGVIIGALVLSWINNTGLAQFGQLFNDQFGTNINFPSYNYLIFGVILVLMMLFRREGLLPEARTRQILREPARVEMESVGADIAEGEAEIEATTPASVLAGQPGDGSEDRVE
jgi:branched-chain amino acid transport system permease protein